jgi:regulator of protease activity HflC (stomatin/prohibitin superfamily)
MGMFIFAIILGIIAICVRVGLNREVKDGDDTYNLKRFKWLAWIPGGLAILFAFFSFFTIISPGNVAVPVTFGSVGNPVGAGIHLKAPWTSYKGISVRTQEYTMVHDSGEGSKNGDDSISVLGADAATANVDATIRYHVDKAKAGDLYKTLGGDYVNIIVRPTSRTCIRNQFANQAIVDAATDKRDDVSNAIKACLVNSFGVRGLIVEDFQLRNISLSSQLQGAVDAKVAAQQQSQQKVFELQKAEADARITTVEAKAKADSQQILACGGVRAAGTDSLGRKVDVVVPNGKSNCNQAQLTPAFLELQRIQALQNLVNAPNNSVIVVPENFQGLLNLPTPSKG